MKSHSKVALVIAISWPEGERATVRLHETLIIGIPPGFHGIHKSASKQVQLPMRGVSHGHVGLRPVLVTVLSQYGNIRDSIKSNPMGVGKTHPVIFLILFSSMRWSV